VLSVCLLGQKAEGVQLSSRHMSTTCDSMLMEVFPVSQKPAAYSGLGDSLAELLSVTCISVLISISLIVYESLWQGGR
jgi:hypothetical protein